MSSERPWRRLLFVTLAAAGMGGCVDLDGFVHNPVHCSAVGSATCEDQGEVWDQVCVPCDEAYDFGRDYPWMAGTLEGGQTLAPLDNGVVVKHAIETTDGEGTLDAYFIPALDGSVNGDTTVLYNHGNYAGIEHYIPRVRFLHQTGFNVLVWDYRGYGKSLPDTSPTAEQFIADARQIRAWADTVVPDPDKLILYANSLGGIPAAEMAVSQAPCALIWEAAFTSMSAISQSNSTLSMGETFLSSGHFNNIEKIKGYDGPFFAMVGDQDIKFPVEHVQQVVDNAPGPKDFWILEGINHGIANGGVPEAGLTIYIDRIQGFLEEHASGCL